MKHNIDYKEIVEEYGDGFFFELKLYDKLWYCFNEGKMCVYLSCLNKNDRECFGKENYLDFVKKDSFFSVLQSNYRSRGG